MKDFFVIGDFGLPITVTVVDENGVFVDISAATTKNIVLRKPDDTTVSKTAVFVTDGTDGKITYVLESGVIDTVGPWKYRGHVIVTPTVDYQTREGAFEVIE